MESKYITKAEAAEYMRISVVTLDKMRARGDVPSIKLGKRVLFERDRLDAVMTANAEQGERAAE